MAVLPSKNVTVSPSGTLGRITALNVTVLPGAAGLLLDVTAIVVCGLLMTCVRTTDVLGRLAASPG